MNTLYVTPVARFAYSVLFDLFMILSPKVQKYLQKRLKRPKEKGKMQGRDGMREEVGYKNALKNSINVMIYPLSNPLYAQNHHRLRSCSASANGRTGSVSPIQAGVSGKTAGRGEQVFDMSNCCSGKLTFLETVVLGNFLQGKILWEITSEKLPTNNPPIHSSIHLSIYQLVHTH